jgi:hypothetical protein
MDRPVVFSQQRVPSNDGYLLEHMYAVAQVTHPGSFIVSPGYGNFLHTEVPFAGDEEDFWIEAPPLDGLELKYSLSRLPSERFKATLGIVEFQAHHGASN